MIGIHRELYIVDEKFGVEMVILMKALSIAINVSFFRDYCFPIARDMAIIEAKFRIDFQERECSFLQAYKTL
jgi:hypothetical protein